MKTEWNTNDAEGWNQYMINSSGNFINHLITTEKILQLVQMGDLLSVIDEDIYFRKNW